jgi:hypothetical protein
MVAREVVLVGVVLLVVVVLVQLVQQVFLLAHKLVSAVVMEETELHQLFLEPQ